MKQTLINTVLIVGAATIGAGAGALARTSFGDREVPVVAPCGFSFAPRAEVLPSERSERGGPGGADVKASQLWPELEPPLRPPLARRLSTLKKCVGFDTAPHTKVRMAIDWRLKVEPGQAEANHFRLVATMGAPAERFTACFQNAFATPVQVELRKGAASDSYEIPGPEMVVFEM